jgi:hypothetical protein
MDRGEMGTWDGGWRVALHKRRRKEGHGGENEDHTGLWLRER